MTGKTACHPRVFFLVAFSRCSGAVLEQVVVGQALVTLSLVFSAILESTHQKTKTSGHEPDNPQNTCGPVAGTHGDVLNVHMRRFESTHGGSLSRVFLSFSLSFFSLFSSLISSLLSFVPFSYLLFPLLFSRFSLLSFSFFFFFLFFSFFSCSFSCSCSCSCSVSVAFFFLPFYSLFFFSSLHANKHCTKH